MKKTRKAASNVNNAVNLISGAYTLPLIDKLFSNRGYGSSILLDEKR